MKFISPIIGNSNTNVEILPPETFAHGKETSKVDSVLNVSFEDAQNLVKAFKTLAKNYPEVGVGKDVKPVSDGLSWQVKLDHNRPLNTRVLRLCNQEGIDKDAAINCCIKAVIKIYRPVDDTLHIQGKSDRKLLHVSTLVASIYMSYRKMMDAAGVMRERLVWNYTVSGEASFIDTIHKAKKADYYQTLINQINSPYRAVKYVMSKSEVPFGYSQAVDQDIRLGNNHINYISFDYYTRDYPREQLADWLTDLCARMQNIYTGKKGKKKKRKTHISAAWVKRLQVKHKLTNEFTFRSVTIAKNHGETSNNQHTKCSLNVAIKHDENNKPRLRFRYAIHRRLLLDRINTYFAHLKNIETSTLAQSKGTVLSVKDFVHMSVTYDNGVETSFDPFHMAARNLTYAVDMEEFSAYQIMAVRPGMLEGTRVMFVDETKGTKARNTRLHFWNCYTQGLFHHARGGKKWQMGTLDEICKITGLTKPTVIQYQKELLTKYGFDVELPATLVKTLEKHALNAEYDLDVALEPPKVIRDENDKVVERIARKQPAYNPLKHESGYQAFVRLGNPKLIHGFEPKPDSLRKVKTAKA